MKFMDDAADRKIVNLVAGAIETYWMNNGFDPSEANEGLARYVISMHKSALHEAGYVIVPRGPK